MRHHGDALRDARATLASLPIYAQGLAGFKNDVKVVFNPHASTASTNGKVVTLPPIPLPTSKSDVKAAKHLAVLVYGFIPHEIGHVRYSDFDVVREAMQESRMLAGLLNAIEDPRQEVELISDFPGTRRHLNALANDCIDKPGFYCRLKPDDSPSWLVSAYSLYVLRGSIREEPEFEALAEQSRPALVEAFGEGFTTRLDVLLDVHGTKMRSSADALALARRVITAMQEEAEPPSEQSQGGDSQDQADGSDPSDSGAGQSGSAQDDQQSGDTSDGADQGNNPPPPATDTQRQSIKDALGAGAGDDIVQDLGEQVAAAIREATGDIRSEERVVDDSSVVASEAGRHDMTPLTGGSFDRDGSLRQSARLRALMRNHFQSVQLQRDHESTRGAFNQRRAFRTAQGDRRLFMKIDDRPGLDTALFVLTDVSGSMEGAPMKLASEAIFVTAVAINELSGTDCAVGTFPGFGMVLKFGQRARLKEDGFGLRAHGGTPMAEGMLWASRKLLATPHRRKILLVVTDGSPARPGVVRAQADALEAAGVEVMALGIKHDAVGTLFSRSAVIHDIDEISGAMLDIVGSALRRQLAAA